MTAKQAKIAIYGAGAMGTVLGALLTKGGLQVELITRNKAHVQGLKEQGARINCLAENTSLTVPVTALLPEDTTDGYDVIFLMTKQRANADVVEFLLPKLSGEGVICTTQNGLPEEFLFQKAGKDKIYGCVATYGANFIGGGAVELTSRFSAMKMQVGAYKGDGKKTTLIAEILACAGTAIGNDTFVEITDNLAGARWTKLALNAAFSGLSVVTGKTFGEIANKGKSRKIALDVIRECIAVANAMGVKLERSHGFDMEKAFGGSVFSRLFAYLVLPFAVKKHKRLRSGMLRDVEEGRRCEIDLINGVVVKLGKDYGVATPVNEKIVEIVRGIENGLYEISYDNLAFIK